MTLVERLEKATGPDRELDAEIWCAAFDGYEVRHDENGMVECYLEETGAIDPPRFTSIIDAALTLRPAGSMWSVCRMEDGPYAQIIAPNANGTFTGGLHQAGAATPALALCIAALRARQHGEG